MKRQLVGLSLIGRPGDDLLSHRWACSTMGAEGFHGRVRNGVGWVTLAMITKPSNQGDRLAWVFGDLGPSDRACRDGHRPEHDCASGRFCPGKVLSGRTKHGFGSFLEGGELYRAIRIG